MIINLVLLYEITIRGHNIRSFLRPCHNRPRRGILPFLLGRLNRLLWRRPWTLLIYWFGRSNPWFPCRGFRLSRLFLFFQIASWASFWRCPVGKRRFRPKRWHSWHIGISTIVGPSFRLRTRGSFRCRTFRSRFLCRRWFPKQRLRILDKVRIIRLIRKFSSNNQPIRWIVLSFRTCRCRRPIWFWRSPMGRRSIENWLRRLLLTWDFRSWIWMARS